MNLEVVVQDPPPVASSYAPSPPDMWKLALTPLTERPNVWHLVAEFENPRRAARQASRFRAGIVHTPEGDWEFTSRLVNGASQLYARHIAPVVEAVRVVTITVTDGRSFT